MYVGMLVRGCRLLTAEMSSLRTSLMYVGMMVRSVSVT